jgi:N-methylhydantoinase A
MKNKPALRIASDIGGAFTDTGLVDDHDTVIASTKTLTTQDNRADGAMAGAVRAMALVGATMGQIGGFIHGTTLATNALIEKRGAVVATITTEEFRDILEIAYERRYSQYDINPKKTDRLVTRDRSLHCWKKSTPPARRPSRSACCILCQPRT